MATDWEVTHIKNIITKKQKAMTTKTQYYKEHLITFKCGYFWALGKCFKTLKAAKKEIEFIYLTKLK